MWFWYAIIFALCSSIIAILAKKILVELDDIVYVFVQRIFMTIFVFLAISLFFVFPKVDNTFWIIIFISSILSGLGAFCDFRAIKLSEVSIIAPISALSPVFTTIISWIFLGEVVSVAGLIGILLIVIGAYSLKTADVDKDFFGPFKMLYKDIGVRYAFLANIIWSVSFIFFKSAIFHTTPQVPPFVSLAILPMTVVYYLPFVVKKTKQKKQNIKKYLPLFLVIGILAAIGEVVGYMAYSLASLGYVTAIFRVSIIFTIIMARLFYKEGGIKNKLIGATIMILGIFFLQK